LGLGEYGTTGPCRPPDLRERRPEQLTGIFRTPSLVPATFNSASVAAARGNESATRG
jgi:hypothetical protein